MVNVAYQGAYHVGSDGVQLPAGLTAWYKPESLAAFGNGEIITSWEDSSGNGYHLTSPTSYHATNLINGYGAAVLCGHTLTNSDVPMEVHQPFTAFAVFQHLGNTGPWGAVASTGSAVGGNDMHLFGNYTGGYYTAHGGNVIQPSVLPANETWVQQSFVSNTTPGSAFKRLRTNVTDEVTLTTGLTYNFNGLPSGLQLGVAPNRDNMCGYVVELIIYSTTSLSDADVDMLDDYLKTKYAL